MFVTRKSLILVLASAQFAATGALSHIRGHSADALFQVVGEREARLDRELLKLDDEFDNEADDFEATEEAFDDQRRSGRRGQGPDGYETDGEGADANSQQQELQEEERYEAARFDLLLRHRLHQSDLEERASERKADEQDSDGDDSSPIEDDEAAKVKQLSEQEMAQRALEQARLEDKVARQRAAVMRSGGMNYAAAAALFEHRAPNEGRDVAGSDATSSKVANDHEAKMRALSEDEKANKALEQARLEEKLARQREAVMRSGITYGHAGALLQAATTSPDQSKSEAEIDPDKKKEGAAKFREMTDDEKAQAASEQARLEEQLAQRQAAIARSGMNYAPGAALIQGRAPGGEASKPESDAVDSDDQRFAKWKSMTEEERAQIEKEEANLRQKLSRQRAAYLRGSGMNYAHAGALFQAQKPKGGRAHVTVEDDRAKLRTMTPSEQVEHDRELARLQQILQKQREAYLRRGGMNYGHGAALAQSGSHRQSDRPFSSRHQKMLKEAEELKEVLEDDGVQQQHTKGEQEQEFDSLDMSSDSAVLESIGKAAQAVKQRRFINTPTRKATSEVDAVEDASEAEWDQEDDTEDEP